LHHPDEVMPRARRRATIRRMSEPTVAAIDDDANLPPWWIPFALGVLALVAGVIVLLKPSDSLDALAVITGIFILIDGIVEVAAALSSRVDARGTVAIIGVLSILAGVLLIRHPVVGVTAVALVLGLWLLAAGAVKMVVAFGDPHHRARRLAGSCGLVAAGILVVASPNIKYATLALFTGLGFIAYGVGLVVIGLALHAAGRDATPAAPRVAT
jgi:uncharacterized membrane protein HdeD (DUF308 family)